MQSIKRIWQSIFVQKNSRHPRSIKHLAHHQFTTSTPQETHTRISCCLVSSKEAHTLVAAQSSFPMWHGYVHSPQVFTERLSNCVKSFLGV